MRNAHGIIAAFDALDRGVDVPDDICQAVRNSAIDAIQGVSLATRLLLKSQTASERETSLHLLKAFPFIPPLLAYIYPEQMRLIGYCQQSADVNLHADDAEMLRRVRDNRPIGTHLVSSFIKRYTNGLLPGEVAALCITMIRLHGLEATDTRYLTAAMVESGSVFDYRPLAQRAGKRIIRRYPTGGVSEKVSLILPSVLAALSDHIPLMSATLVARSLSFTGGTWDKMAVIPGFTFASPGQETEDILAQHRVALCTTNDAVCPADRALYTLRSHTGNVISKPLIVSSICSKHLALPVHRILMDVRFGPGSFMPNEHAAQDLGDSICLLFEAEGIPSDAILVGTQAPTGSAIGNVVEVVESISIMGGNSALFPKPHPSMTLQRQLVHEQALRLIKTAFPEYAATIASLNST